MRLVLQNSPPSRHALIIRTPLTHAISHSLQLSSCIKRKFIISREVSSCASSSSSSASSNPLLVPFSQVKENIGNLFNVFPNDQPANKRLLVLVIGQSLCSVATLIHDSYLPVYAQDVLGLSSTSIGAVQGIAQLLTQLTKGVSGVVGDLLGSQVRVLAFGVFMTFFCKPMFVLLSTVHLLAGPIICLYFFFFAKLLDRMSKGIREAPSKAIINELAREAGESPDAAYGLRQSLATFGALAGSGIASITFALTGQSYERTFAVAMIPPLLALIWIVSNFSDELKGKSHTSSAEADSPSLSSVSASQDNDPQEKDISIFKKASILISSFKPAYWQALIVISILYMARFDASFLSLRAKETSLPKTLLPMIALISSLCQVLLTAPLSRWAGSNVANRNKLLSAGFAAMVITNGCFALTSSSVGMFIGAFWLGIHMAATHSITISMVAAYMPTGSIAGLGKLSGTAVSFTDLLLGVVLAASNTVAGVLSDMTRQAGLGNIGCFAGGAAASILAGLSLVVFDRWGDLGKDELIARKKR